jgi:putative transposase
MRSRVRTHRRSYNEPGHAHELTFSCYQGYAFLKSDRTCAWLAEAISQARAVWAFDLWAYVFMPEHAHLIVHPRQIEYDIASIRRAIKEPVGRQAIRYLRQHAPEWLPRLTRRRGRRKERLFWQSGGGYDRNITDAKALLSMIDYIHLNPVRRGLVEQAAQWKWSSAAWIEGVSDSPVPLDPISPEWLMTGTP